MRRVLSSQVLQLVGSPQRVIYGSYLMRVPQRACASRHPNTTSNSNPRGGADAFLSALYSKSAQSQRTKRQQQQHGDDEARAPPPPWQSKAPPRIDDMFGEDESVASTTAAAETPRSEGSSGISSSGALPLPESQLKEDAFYGAAANADAIPDTDILSESAAAMMGEGSAAAEQRRVEDVNAIMAAHEDDARKAQASQQEHHQNTKESNVMMGQDLASSSGEGEEEEMHAGTQAVADAAAARGGGDEDTLETLAVLAEEEEEALLSSWSSTGGAEPSTGNHSHSQQKLKSEKGDAPSSFFFGAKGDVVDAALASIGEEENPKKRRGRSALAEADGGDSFDEVKLQSAEMESVGDELPSPQR